MITSNDVDAICSRDDLADFIERLGSELRSGGSWENSDLESFLEAMAAWTRDMEGYHSNRSALPPVTPEWKTLGEILLGATQYE